MSDGKRRNQLFRHNRVTDVIFTVALVTILLSSIVVASLTYSLVREIRFSNETLVEQLQMNRQTIGALTDEFAGHLAEAAPWSAKIEEQQKQQREAHLEVMRRFAEIEAKLSSVEAGGDNEEATEEGNHEPAVERRHEK